MNRRVFAAFFAIVAFAGAQFLHAENDAARGEIESAVEKIRELKFLQPVVFDVVSHVTIKATLEKKLAEQYSDGDFKNTTLGLAALGLLDRDFPLKQKLLDLLGEQVAAFYDQHAHKLFMFEDAKLELLQNKIILAHELTHALQDQNFGLAKLPLEIKTNDDRAIAASALVEGDATLVMSEYMMKNMTGAGAQQSLAGLMSQSTQQIEHAPRFLRETLMFPYVQGEQFCATLQQHGGWKAVSDAFKNPPSSSAQILHPEKYLATPREEPVAISWSGNDTTALGKKPIDDNVLGELGVRILISEWLDAETAEKVAGGWRGDRYLVFDDGKNLVLRTRWKNGAAAEAFVVAIQQCWAKRRDADASRKSRFLQIENLAPDDVLLIDAATQEWAVALAEKFLRQ